MSRDVIFAKIRRSSSGPVDPKRGHIIPARARVTGADGSAVFVKHLEAHGVLVEHVPSAASVPVVVKRCLDEARLPPRIRIGQNTVLRSLPWQGADGLQCVEGAATSDDLAALSVAIAGIAETGAVVLVSGPDNPCTLAFLPDVHFVMVYADDIIASMEQGLQKVHDASGNKPWPRAVNLISAASRTGDIGGQLVMGAHGPRRLIVMIIDG